MKTEVVNGIQYQHPTVTLLHASPLVNAELAGRICYDSFENSEHEQVRNFNGTTIEDVEHSDLLDSLCHVYHHMSIAEHANLTYLIKGTSRGVLQEHARHRIQSISVRSTRYTMSSVINAFVASQMNYGSAIDWFINKVMSFDILVVNGNAAYLELKHLYEKLYHQRVSLGSIEFDALAIPKSSFEFLIKYSDSDELFEALQNGKKKRNVGDAFKWVVTDNWKVDMVVTMNLRALKNYLTLRDSGAAYFQIRNLAQAIKAATPSKYLDLIVKENTNVMD